MIGNAVYAPQTYGNERYCTGSAIVNWAWEDVAQAALDRRWRRCVVPVEIALLLGRRPLATSRLSIFLVDLESNGGHAASASATGSPAGEHYFIWRQRIWQPTTSDDVEHRRRSVILQYYCCVGLLVLFISCFSGKPWSIKTCHSIFVHNC